MLVKCLPFFHSHYLLFKRQLVKVSMVPVLSVLHSLPGDIFFCYRHACLDVESSNKEQICTAMSQAMTEAATVI